MPPWTNDESDSPSSPSWLDPLRSLRRISDEEDSDEDESSGATITTSFDHVTNSEYGRSPAGNVQFTASNDIEPSTISFGGIEVVPSEGVREEMVSGGSGDAEYGPGDAIKWAAEEIAPDSKLKYGHNMETNTEMEWWLEEASAHNTTSELLALYRGDEHNELDGFDAIRQFLLDKTVERIEEDTDRHGMSRVEAFNRATAEWPHFARAWLAKYEADNGHDSESYNVADYARSAGIMDEPYDQTTIDCWYDDVDLEDYGSRERKTLLLIRAVDRGANNDILQDIEDHEAFREALKETGSVNAALYLEQYDSSVPHELLEEAAPPAEWDELDPANIKRERCRTCRSLFYHIEREGRGPMWVREDGNPTGATYIPDDDRYEILANDDLLCSRCENDFVSNSKSFAFFGGNNETRGRFTNGIFARYDEDDVWLSELGPREQDLLLSMLDHGPVGGWFAVTPNTNVGDRTPQAQAIEDLISGEETLEAEEVVAVDSPERAVYLERDNYDAAREVKEYLEAQVEDDEAQPQAA